MIFLLQDVNQNSGVKISDHSCHFDFRNNFFSTTKILDVGLELCRARTLCDHHNSPSLSFAGTSITRGLSMILADRFPFSTIPMIQAWYPSCFSMSLQKAAACSRGKDIRRPPTSTWNSYRYHVSDNIHKLSKYKLLRIIQA